MNGVLEITSRQEFVQKRPQGPEAELLLAALDRAALDYYSARSELRKDAANWLFQECDADHIFSFNWVCEHLGLNPHAVQKRIQELKLPKSVAQTHRWLRRKVKRSRRRVSV